MASTNFAKTVYCLAGAGTLFGLGYAGKSLIIGDRIVDLLKQHNPEKKLLTRTTANYSARWKKAWFQYRKDHENSTKDAWGLGDWEKRKSNEVIKEDKVAPTSFIDACDRNSQERVSSTSNELYQQVKKWCTSDSKISIDERIRETGKRILREGIDSKTKDDAGWKPLLKKYWEANKGKEENVLGIVGLAKDLTEKDALKEDGELMKSFIEKCTNLSKETVEGTEHSSYQNALNHCADDMNAEDLVKESGKKMIDLSKFKNQNGSNVPIAREIWQRYLNKNRDRAIGKDEWEIKEWNPAQKQDDVIPDSFWDNCTKKRRTIINSVEDKEFDEVNRYCSIEETKSADYTEIVK